MSKDHQNINLFFFQNTCPQTYVLIPSASAEVLGGTICGGLFNPEDGMAVSGSVQGEEKAFFPLRNDM